ncbi:ABC transporter substrate-binding protein [Bradyrhizobium jicamae]|nr:ABC transporter substrate-binding protein [Bradyrhizobium jicamae]
MGSRSGSRRFRLGLPLFAGLVIVSTLAALILVRQRPTRSEALTAKAVPIQYTLKLGGPVSLTSAGTIMAIADGLFLREGLQLRLVAGSTDGDAISAVASDEHTIGLASTAAFLKARAEGLPIVAFAASYAVSPVEFFTMPDVALYTPTDLEGKRIGYRSGPETAAILYDFINRNAVAQSRLHLVESDTALQDLLDRKIDVLLGRRDIDGQELERLNIEYKVFSPESYGVHAPGPVYFANERAFDRLRNLEKYLIATADGWTAVYTDYKRTVPVIAKSIETPLAVPLLTRLLEEQRRFLRPFGTRFGELDPRPIRLLQEQLLQRRIIENTVDLTRAVNYDVVREAYRREANSLSRIEP